MKFSSVVLAFAAIASTSVQAADSIDLGAYRVSATYGLALSVGNVSGLEGSAITYARDRGTLFFVGDEGTGVIETSLTGQTLGSMSFDWTGTATTNQDTEGLTYLGSGVLVVTEERLYDAYQFQFSNGGSARLASKAVSISNATVGNNGLEGISYDPRNGGFVTVKQQSPQDILSGQLLFETSGGIAAMSQLFNPALMGLSTLSDVQTLSPVDRLVGTSGADNLLVLSLGSRRLVEVNRSGLELSSLDLSGILSHNAVEGVTVDEKGTIYLIAEQIQDGSNLPFDPNPKSQLIVLTAPVPEPGAYVLMAAGLGVLGVTVRRRKRTG